MEQSNNVLLRHTVSVAFIQDTTKNMKRKGEDVVVEVKHSVEFKETTNLEITSENLSNYLIGKLTQYQLMQKLQGKKDRFDLSLPIEMSVKIDNMEKQCSIKFSTNLS